MVYSKAEVDGSVRYCSHACYYKGNFQDQVEQGTVSHDLIRRCIVSIHNTEIYKE